MTEINQFRPGALVRSRERDWVVVPQEENQVIRLRPVDGTDEEAIGVFLPLEQDAIGMSKYPPPNSNHAGDFTGALLLRDALRLALRNGPDHSAQWGGSLLFLVLTNSCLLLWL